MFFGPSKTPVVQLDNECNQDRNVRLATLEALTERFAAAQEATSHG
jgi:hypothetical protein